MPAVYTDYIGFGEIFVARKFSERRPPEPQRARPADDSTSAVPPPRREIFTRCARWTERVSGHPGTFALALGAVLVWAATGPLFGYSDTWQLVINTATTVVTFLMVFLIQGSQNRKSEALQLKVDELIRALREAKNDVLDLEDRSEDELSEIKDRFVKLAELARAKAEGRNGERRGNSVERVKPAKHGRDATPRSPRG
jgi:low affinity Fe/Cu permease